MISGHLVNHETGEVIDFDEVAKQIAAMPVDQKAQAWMTLVESGKLKKIESLLKNGVIDHMRDNEATKLAIPQGEVTLKASSTAQYNHEAIKKILPDAIRIEEKLDRRIINDAKKLGGDTKKAIDDAELVAEPKYSLTFKAKPTAEVE